MPSRFAQAGKNPYNPLGLGLVLFGPALSLVSFFVLDSIPLTALGISIFILGAICISLARTRPSISPEVSRILLETGMENTAAIVEELGLSSNAIYLPSSIAKEGGRAIIPLKDPSGSGVQIMDHVPKRLIAKYGDADDDIGILVATAGAACLRILGARPGSSSAELESAITSVLIGALDVADGVRVNATGAKATVEIAKPRLEYRNIRFYQCIGSPLASIVATMVCESTGKPVVIEREVRRKGKSIIELRMIK